MRRIHRFAGLAFGLLVGGFACDEIDFRPDGVSVDDFRRTCLRQCANAAGGEGCDREAVLSACDGVCEVTSFEVSSACLTAYDALVACEANRDFVCNGAVEVNGVDWPVLADRVECDDADALYRECPEADYTL